MKRSVVVLTFALATLSLTACAEDRYGYGGVYRAGNYPYSVYYDDYYGPIYDGYWGTNGYFYYRSGERDRDYRRGDRDHFRKDGDHPGGHFRPLQGDIRPPHGARMPHFGGAGRDGDQQGRHRDRDHP